MFAQSAADIEKTSTAPKIGYWKETRQPLYSLALVLPLVVIYQGGIILLHSEFINGGDAIVQTLFGRFFHLLGMKISFFSGSISLAILLLYLLIDQFRKKAPWRIEMQSLATVSFECLIWAALLFMLLAYAAPLLPKNSVSASPPLPIPQAQAVARSTEKSAGKTTRAATPQKASRPDIRPQENRVETPVGPQLQDFVLYCGAGVYEELVFRVFLFALLMLIFQKQFHMESAYAAVWSVLLGAVIFSAFHHIGGEAFTWSRFLQRTIAGLFFSALYVTRSFGVAAASHSLYDIIVGLSYLS